VLGFARKRAMMASETTPLSDVRFLTVAEVATIMRVSKMTVYRLVHSGELEAIRVGRSFRVPEQAVNQYLRAAYVGTG
jgi:excisionase family DNA binding protein